MDATVKAYPKFKTLHLAHNQDINEKLHRFTLDDMHASYHGFTHCGTYPHEFTEDTVALSFLVDDLVVVVYANKNTRSYFAVGLGYYLGQGWVHVLCDKCPSTQNMDWERFGRRAYYRMWRARAEHARNMSKQEHADLTRNAHFVKHAHLPRSIWANDWGGPCMPGLMDMVPQPYSLELDWWRTRVDKCFGQRLSLGDYGDCVDGILICTGNIFWDMRIIGIDPEDSAYQPVVSHVSGKSPMTNQADIAMAYHSTSDTTLALHRAKGISLPNNKHFVLLLKAFSTRLAGKHLVTTLIQCSDIYTVDCYGNRIDSENGGLSESGRAMLTILPLLDVVPDSGMHAAEPGILTPFYAIASPQVWRREPPCVRRREEFKSIRKHFYALVNIHQPTGHKLCRKLANKREMDRAVKFFSDMFGLKYLRDYNFGHSHHGYYRTRQHCYVLTGQRDITWFGAASNPVPHSRMHATKSRYPYCITLGTTFELFPRSRDIVSLLG
ncbi:hypothetical protein EDD15DRAFT_2196822 [Pisolithus albus]|nr:hypothetical protein EDD15DRAFT_2196822 [Pisolithus albus]